MVLKLEGIDIALSEVRVHSKLMQARSPQWNSLSVNRLVWQSTPMKKTGNSSLRTSFSAQTKAFQSSATHKYESHKKKNGVHAVATVSLVSGPAASASPRGLLEMQNSKIY